VEERGQGLELEQEAGISQASAVEEQHIVVGD